MSGGRQVLRVGVDEAPPIPLCFGVPGTVEFMGFEVDLLHLLAQRLDVELQYSSALWSDILRDLQEGRLDLVCGAATITAERRQQVAFSEPYLESDLMLVAREDGPVTDLGELGRRKIGVRIATVAEDYVRQRCAADRIETFDFNVDQYRALAEGRVQVVCDDGPIAAYYAAATPGLKLGPRLPGTTYQYGIALARGNDRLRRDINRALAGLREDTTLARLADRWLGTSALHS